jgi:molybdopterin-guanine dinucleotide biosynthesis protein A
LVEAKPLADDVPMIAGIILAGGKGERIGGRKALLPFGTGTLIDAVIARAAPQVERLALNVPSTDELLYRARFAARFDVLADPFEQGTGPLAGIVAGLAWGKAMGGVEWLASFPCDAPFLPRDLVPRLLKASEAGRPCAAEDDERLQGVCAIWPVRCLDRLREGVEAGVLRSPFAALELLGGTRCRFDDAGAFFNVNTREDLAKAETMVRGRRCSSDGA